MSDDTLDAIATLLLSAYWITVNLIALHFIIKYW